LHGADTYTIEVSLQAFKTVKRAGIIVSGGDPGARRTRRS
jgi:hypothetical protein